ncbi:hypothetical protein H6F78_11455 [Coleofasciculus sp. FACHB-64]|uniref:hypothetical protein n=1 Tax=Cyanophyceae TaxID=3028117 RepID=UPI0016826DEB|nr:MULTISPECIES: hypothetical protein [unclassified Coleofasciculus]MBD1838105.1 hypothetical protein [Coleofasciculus sp. FACHB-501]MBD1879316.1 hypothetical protein [Coleofasciculus sp. FACHB-T130]MBD1888068.1 hypothetical protein [Coleofasciculus sp. FACHB-SPT9]MBD2046201.1 hypothetical protein [Coleofasciculus sp. FACHB-64]
MQNLEKINGVIVTESKTRDRHTEILATARSRVALTSQFASFLPFFLVLSVFGVHDAKSDRPHQ